MITTFLVWLLDDIVTTCPIKNAPAPKYKKKKRVKDASKDGLRRQQIRLATAVIKFRNKERKVRSPS